MSKQKNESTTMTCNTNCVLLAYSEKSGIFSIWFVFANLAATKSHKNKK